MRPLVLVPVVLAASLIAMPGATAACSGDETEETQHFVTLPGVAVDRERRSLERPECSSGAWRLSASATLDTGLGSVGASGVLLGVSWFEDRSAGAPFDEHAAIETAAADVYWDQQCTGPTSGWAGAGVALPFGFMFQPDERLCALPDPSETGRALANVLP
ncbi:MAG TPA: hypothetical protein VI997_02295 [Candidatus Thermoplasmatota archaeon]|nr:hypothetical protein [Candidatus Thermoplasmatota archaeon]